MNKFRMVVNLSSGYLPYPEGKYIKNSILQNNDKFIYYKDDLSPYIIILCNNKPKDLFIFGIYFEKIK